MTLAEAFAARMAAFFPETRPKHLPLAVSGGGDSMALLHLTAGRAYLESYSSAPTGNRAPDALLKLGVSLANLGQVSEACATLGAMDRFPGSAQLTTANAERQRLGCS